MTNNEAIGILAIVVETAKGRCFVTDEAISDAYAMAISALQEQEAKNSNESSLTQKALDTISRQDAIRWVKTECNPYGKPTIDFESGKRVIEHLKRMSSAHPIQPNTSNTLKSLDCIDRKAAIDALKKNRSIYCDNTPESFRCLPHDEKSRVDEIDACIAELVNLPSAQPEPLSDAYMKSVWTWLLDYQIKVAKLKGRYTPYEVLSWVANDWRKEHE